MLILKGFVINFTNKMLVSFEFEMVKVTLSPCLSRFLNDRRQVFGNFPVGVKYLPC